MTKDTIYKILGDVERDIRESYTGGAVDVYRPHNTVQGYSIADPRAKIPLYYYDVNSLYPFVMSTRPMPVGKPVAFEGNIRAVDPKAFGFFYCDIETPGLMANPILQRKIETPDGVRTIAGLGKWTGWLSSFEVDNAIHYGYKISIIKGYKFDAQYIFEEYIDHLYRLRTRYPKDQPLNLIAKLLMNSLYGKFGMRPYHSVVEIHDVSTDEGTQQFYDMLESYDQSIQD